MYIFFFIYISMMSLVLSFSSILNVCFFVGWFYKGGERRRMWLAVSVFKSSGSSRQRQPDYFVEFQLHHAPDNQTYSHACHYIDELHNIIHHIGTQILQKEKILNNCEKIILINTYLSSQPSCGRWRNDSSSFWHLCHRRHLGLDC